MENQKGIAIVLAMFAAVLVMLAGKACSDNINKKNKNNSTAASAGSMNATVQGSTLNRGNIQEYTVTNGGTEQTESIEYITDLLGRVVGTVEQTTTEPTEAETEPKVEYVTDLLGRVVSVIEPETQPTTEDPTATTEYKNPLEEYREKYPVSTKASNTDIDDEYYTVPSSLYITIG